MNIYFIGMPGSGKSTVARQFAKKINQTFIDLDDLIAKKALMFVEDIFEKYGEETFRKLEHEALLEVSQYQDTVISCGGGIVLNKSHKDIMQGYTVYIDTELDVIKERIDQDISRPLLKKMSLETIYEQRYLKYLDFADMIISNDHHLDDVVHDLILRLKEKNIL